MQPYTIEELTKRVSRLERQNSIFKGTALFGLLGVVAIILLGQTASNQVIKVVEAEKFVVRDPQGLVRATLSSDSNGVGLQFYDESDRLRLSLSYCLNATGIRIYNENGSVGANLGTDHIL